ncbi:glycosyltransferase family 2 protein [Rummeliibacillus sp. NPDC094406]|uniref:glycosyltransferase family 2 protein n=1 Tax=Rummeliibacillus sp. NPDC094406 TaxID=3364511 RepID=UPI003808BF32
MNPEISIIIPVYNVEKYLNRCITSIINQTFKNIEIILVNDGSKDLSGELCDHIAKSDNRIIVIHKQNGGSSSARNAGLKKARGDYIAFVDSDDWVSLDMYEYLYKIINEHNADIAQVCDYVTAKKTKIKNKEIKEVLISGKEKLIDYFIEAQFSVCVRLFKREVFNGIIFPEGKINEDIVTNYKLLLNSSKIAKSNQIMYFYFRNPRSNTNSKVTKKDRDLLNACFELCELTKNDIELERLARTKLARSYFSLLMKGYLFGIDKTLNKKKFEQYCVKKIRSNYFLLMNSNIAINRKILITLSIVHPKLLEILAILYLIVRNKQGVQYE